MGDQPRDRSWSQFAPRFLEDGGADLAGRSQWTMGRLGGRMCDLTPDRLVTLSDTELAPFEARSYVRQHACPEHTTIALDALSLIASELATNAMRHGQPPIVLRLSCLTSEVRLSVSDTGPRLPHQQGPRGALDNTGPRLPHAQGTRGGLGLGLVIVARVAQEWGTTPLALGKEVWCRVPTGMLPVRRALESPMPLDLP